MKLGILGTAGHCPDSEGQRTVPQEVRETGHSSSGIQADRVFLSEYERLHEAFVAHERARGRRDRGVAGCARRAKRFLSFLVDEEVAPQEITPAVARRYLSELSESLNAEGRRLEARTIAASRIAASCFCRYLVGERILPLEPFSHLRPTRTPKKVLTGVVKPAELLLVLEALSEWDADGVPARHQGRRFIAQVVAELQYASGLRISEVASLTNEDLALERGLIRVRSGKGGRDRWAYLGHYAGELLALYLRHRDVLLSGIHDADDTRLFACGYDALGHSQNAHLKRVEQETGVKMRSHGFRHALGYHLLRNGCPLRVIQEILGHVLLKDTEVYTRLDVEDVKQTVDRFHPLGPAA